MAGRIARGEVRLYTFAPPDKTRPVVILTNDAAIAHLANVTVAPISSTIRGVPSEVALDEDDGMKALCVVNLHNTASVPQDRIGKRVAQLSAVRMNKICAALALCVGCGLN